MVAGYLKPRGYEVVEAVDGIQGLDRGLASSASVILLDVVMPGLDGFKVCQLLRENGVKTPIIIFTERSSLDDKVTGFSAGADDYLPKPFSPVELELRIQALMRRANANGDALPSSGSIITRGDLEIDLEKHLVTLQGNEVPLTPIEFNILKLLASTPGHVYTRQDLLSVIWDTGYQGYKRNIDPHVTRLRNKIEENPKHPKYILTVWGIGYKFTE